MRERKAKRPESGRGAGENNGHGESRSAAGGERPDNRQRRGRGGIQRKRAARTTRSAATRPPYSPRRRRSESAKRKLDRADPQARLAERREARTKRSVSQRSRGARWSFRASDSARPGFHGGRTPERIGKPMEAEVVARSGTTRIARSVISRRGRVCSLRLKKGAAPFQPKLTSPDSRSETKGRSPRPRMTWSSISIWRIRPASTSWRVMRMSSAEGVASPLG